jgi:8-oxo-dGTP pyrophosphatase MutT (NUDIX family)
VRINPARLRERLGARPRHEFRHEGFRESAVLVPILSEPDGDTVVLTLRHDDLPTHAGQISFPGGKRDARDVDAAATAIRETSEELGVEPAAVEVLGLLDDVPTPTGFVITPVVARLVGALELRPSLREVAEVLRAPLAELSRPGAFREAGQRVFLGVTYTMLEFPLGTRSVWGATARILHQLVEQLGQAK